jgi:hypothetical protein
MEALDRLLPAHEFADTVEVAVAADAPASLRAAREATAREMPLSLVLLILRALPLMITRRRLIAPRGPLWDDLASTPGFIAFEDEPGKPLLLGYVGRPWKPAAEGAPLETLDQFLAFDEPGWAKVAAAFWTEPNGDGVRLLTETRIHLTDEHARRNFGRYWRLVHFGSVLLRREWLGAARRRAESSRV